MGQTPPHGPKPPKHPGWRFDDTFAGGGPCAGMSIPKGPNKVIGGFVGGCSLREINRANSWMCRLSTMKRFLARYGKSLGESQDFRLNHW